MSRVVTLTLNQATNRLQDAGMNIGEQKLKEAIKLGIFQGAAWHIPMVNDEFIILAKDLDEWITAHSMEIEPTEEMWEVARQMSECKEAI